MFTQIYEQILLNWYITQSNELFYSIVLENYGKITKPEPLGSPGPALDRGVGRWDTPTHQRVGKKLTV